MADDSVDWQKHLMAIGLGGATNAIGAMFGNPLIAWSVGMIIPTYDVYRDFRDRRLSKRESEKLDAVAVQSLRLISERLAAGDKLRDDGFFAADSSEQPAAKELLEGVLLAVRDTHQDKKIPFYAELFANVAFTSNCDSAEANYLLTMLGRLSFRQLCLLRLIRESRQFPIYHQEMPKFITTQWDLLSALNEIIDMFQMNVVKIHNPHTFEHPHPEPARMGFEYMSLLQPGQRLFKLAGLKNIAAADMDTVCSLFPVNLDEIAKADRDRHEAERGADESGFPPNETP